MQEAPRVVQSADPEELAERALRWVLRGGTFPGLAREIAWQACCTAGVGRACLDWLTELVEARLAERVDGLEFVIDRACDSAKTEHARTWPNDPVARELAASAAGHDEGVQALCRLYLEALEWASELLADRLGSTRRAADRPRVSPVVRTRPIVAVEPPSLVTEQLAPSDGFGWPRRAA
jgi:hypothetical protein